MSDGFKPTTAHRLRAAIVLLVGLGAVGCGEGEPLPTSPPVESSSSVPTSDSVDDWKPEYNPDGTLSAKTMREISGTILKRGVWQYRTSAGGKTILEDLKKGVHSLAKMPRLRHLRIEDTSEQGLVESDYREIARLDRVESIQIYGHKEIDSAALAPLAGMPRLKTLEFEEVQVWPTVVAPLTKSQSLEELRIGTGSGIVEEAERLDARFRVIHTQNYEP